MNEYTPEKVAELIRPRCSPPPSMSAPNACDSLLARRSGFSKRPTVSNEGRQHERRELQRLPAHDLEMRGRTLSRRRDFMTTDLDALIAEARGFAAGSESARATLMRDLADALESVREAGHRIYADALAESERLRGELERSRSNNSVLREEVRQERELADADVQRLAETFNENLALKAALSRAEETIEAVKALHFEHENTIHTTPATVCAHRYCVDGMGDQVAWPCPTGRILTDYQTK